MTPKEKAKELYWKCYQNVSDSSYPEETAKKCVLIIIDEILDKSYELNYTEHQFDYWYKIKQEIEKL